MENLNFEPIQFLRIYVTVEGQRRQLNKTKDMKTLAIPNSCQETSLKIRFII